MNKIVVTCYRQENCWADDNGIKDANGIFSNAVKEMEQQKLTRVVFVTKFFSSEATFAATYIPERQ